MASGTSSPAAFEIRASSAGQFTARGVLSFGTARRAWELGLQALHSVSARELEVDCSGVTAADSAGLVVLLDWLATVRREGRSLRYVHLPASLLSVAAISDVEGLLREGVRP